MADKETKRQLIAVRYCLLDKQANTALIEVDPETLKDEDRAWGACEDELEEKFGESPKWHRILGTVTIKPLKL